MNVNTQVLRRSSRLASVTEKGLKRDAQFQAIANDLDGQLSNGGRAKNLKCCKMGALSRSYEQSMVDLGFKFVAGVDEAGRGPLAGPVVAAACAIPLHVTIDGIDDSKRLQEEERERLYEMIVSHKEISWHVACVDVEVIDEINILQATMLAMEEAVAGLGKKDDMALLVDGNRLPKSFDEKRSRAIVKGDSKCISIAAASILAKVTRDRIMVNDLHTKYPQYNFKQHKGYAVPEHYDAIRKHGPCPAHRRTFAPVRHWFPREEEATSTKRALTSSQSRRSKKGRS